MSLLLEALKKAEAAKRQEDALPVANASAAVEPPPARITPAHELELIDDEFAQAARFAGLDVPEPQPATPPPPLPGMEAARALFDAKRPPRGKSPLIWLLGVAGLLLLGICAWVVWQIGVLDTSRNADLVAAQPPSVAPVAHPAPLPPLAASAATRQTPEPDVPPAPSAMADSLAVTPAAPTIRNGTAHSTGFLSGQLAPEAPAPTVPEATAPVAVPIRITRNTPIIPQDISEGYTAFNAGEFDRSRIAYERALRIDPRNPDALHGLAALAEVRGDERQARALLRRIAEIDPADPAVQAALSDSVDPAIHEARLLNITAAQPQSAPAAFALGNLYAAQARWREAQQAYFNALTLAPDQPDHAYNLAISLDQLRQPRLALQYYREALSLRAQRAAAFDAQAVATRIQTLQARQEGH